MKSIKLAAGECIDPAVQERMRLRHKSLLFEWRRWIEHYGSQGLRLSLRQPSSRTHGELERPPATILFDWGLTPTEQCIGLLGFQDYFVEYDLRQKGWVAHRQSLLTNGDAKMVEVSSPFTTELAASAHCARWEVAELARVEMLNPGSYERIPVIPLNCRAIRMGDLEAVVNAHQSLRRRVFPERYDICRRIDQALDEIEYDRLLDEFQRAELLDAVALRGIIPPGPCIPRDLVIPLQRALRCSGRRSLRMMESTIAYCEVVLGWVRMGYCFYSLRALRDLIEDKVGIYFSMQAFKKQLERLGLFTLYRDRTTSPSGL